MKKNRTLLTKTQISELEEDKIGRPVLALNENDSVKIEIDNNKKFNLETQDEKQQDLLEDKGIFFKKSINGKLLLVDVGQQVGAAPLTNFIIKVNPKFSKIENLGRLIHYANGFDEKNFLDGQIKFKSDHNVGLEYIIELLTFYTKKIIKDGLYRTYVSVREDIPYLKGKLLMQPTEDTSGQLLNDAKFNLKFSCQYDEYSANVLENQILLYTLKICQRKTKQQHKKIEIQRLIHQIDYDVETLPYITPDVFVNLQYTALNQRYKIPLQYCKMILKNFGLLNLNKQETDFVTPFFIPMFDLFQDFIGHLLKNPKYYRLYTKNDWSYNRDKKQRKKRETRRISWVASRNGRMPPLWKMSTIPDIIAYTDYGRTKVHSILDAKYVLDDGKISPSILYQIAFYLNDYDRDIGYIIQPYDGKSKDYEIKSVHQKPLEIRVRHINVEKTLEWIFGKSEQNTTKIRKMLLEKFPISFT